MTKNDVLLLLTHGSVSGMCARPPIATPADIGLQAVQVAQHALDALQATGFRFDDDSLADPPTVSVVGENYRNTAFDPEGAKSMAHEIRDTDQPLVQVKVPLIQDFQRAAGLKDDGIAGPKTLAAYLFWSEQP